MVDTKSEAGITEFLESTNLVVTEASTIQSLRRDLRQLFGVKPGEPSNFGNKFLEAVLKRGVPIEAGPVERGIKAIYVHYVWGMQLRYVIPGARGLFGLAAVNRYIQSLM